LLLRIVEKHCHNRMELSTNWVVQAERMYMSLVSTRVVKMRVVLPATLSMHVVMDIMPAIILGGAQGSQVGEYMMYLFFVQVVTPATLSMHVVMMDIIMPVWVDRVTILLHAGAAGHAEHARGHDGHHHAYVGGQGHDSPS